MAITITKPKTQASTDVVILSDHAVKIDNVAKLELDLATAEAKLVTVAKKEVERIQDLTRKLKEAKAELDPLLQAEFAEEDADTAQVARGHKFQAELGKKGNERVVADIKLIHDILEDQEPGLFFKLCSIKLGDIDQYLTPQEKKATVDTNRTKRSIKFTKRV